MEHLNEELTTRIKLLGAFANNTGFSVYLLALSQAIDPDVWLTTINISLTDQTMQIKGNALKAIAVQQFLNQLAHQAVFAGTRFSLEKLIKIASADKKTNEYISFSATSKAISLTHE